MPKQLVVSALDRVKELVMVHPKDGNDEEADKEAEELRRDYGKGVGELRRTWVGAEGRQLYIKDHDGDDDGENSVTKGFKAIGLGLEFGKVHGRTR